MPKSITLTSPEGVTIRFAGFRLRCTTPAACAYLERLEHAGADGGGVVDWQPAHAGHELLERLAADELHHHQERIAFPRKLVDGGDAWVSNTKRGCGSGRAIALIGGIEGQGFKTAMKVLDRGRLHMAGVCAGVARRLIRDSLAFAMGRRQFGQPIAEFQLIQAMLADSETECAAAEALVLATARRRDRGERVTKEAAMCKYFASEMVGRVADRAVQIHGGAGYMADYAVERLYRDVRLFRHLRGHLADPAADHRPRDAARGRRSSAATAPASAAAYEGLPHDRFRWVGESVTFWARQAPARIALGDRRATLTYAELEALLEAVEERLAALGARGGRPRPDRAREQRAGGGGAARRRAPAGLGGAAQRAPLAAEVDTIRAHCSPRVTVYTAACSPEARAHGERHQRRGRRSARPVGRDGRAPAGQRARAGRPTIRRRRWRR